jgi:muramidase (phage lysozyme)
MGIFAPEINTEGSAVQAATPAVNLTEGQLTNLGKSIADIIGGLTPPKPAEGLVSEQETEEEFIQPEITPTSPDSGLSIQAQAFLDAIASAEGTGGDYNIIVGGKRFSSYEEHPGIVGLKTKAGPSTAAGKYQITKQTWEDLKSRYPDLTDFSPANQDKAAYYLAVERYKRGSPGRDLSADLAAGNTSYLRKALDRTWTGIQVYKDFENVVKKNAESATTVTLKPVGFTTIRYSNEQAIRNKPVSPELELKLDVAVSTVLGAGYTVDVFSGGQEKQGKGVRRTGSIRHDVDDLGRGLAADVRIFDPTGNQITDRAKLDKVRDFWIQKNYGSVGTYMPGSGIHFDIWTKDKLLPGMSSTWSY